MMNYITRRQVRGQDVILLEEIIDHVADGAKFQLMLKAGIMKLYKIIPPTVIRSTPSDLSRGLFSYMNDGRAYRYEGVNTGTESLQEVPWDAVSAGVFVLWADIEPLLLSEPVEQQADQGQVETEKDKSRAFVLSHRNIINKLYGVTRKCTGSDALEKAIKYLTQNPHEHLLPEHLSIKDFPDTDTPSRDYKGYLAIEMLKHSPYKMLTITEIQSILPEKKRTKK